LSSLYGNRKCSTNHRRNRMKENFEEATSFENAEILRQQKEIRKLREEIRLLEKLAKLRSVANQLGVGDEDERVAPV